MTSIAFNGRHNVAVRRRHRVTVNASLMDRIFSDDTGEFQSRACFSQRVAERTCGGLCFHVSVVTCNAFYSNFLCVFYMRQDNIAATTFEDDDLRSLLSSL